MFCLNCLNHCRINRLNCVSCAPFGDVWPLELLKCVPQLSVTAVVDVFFAVPHSESEALTCIHAECPHTPRRWSRGFWDTRRRTDGPALYRDRSTRPWTPPSPTPDSWSHNPPLWACPERSGGWSSRPSRRTLNWNTRPRGSGTRWSAGMTGAEDGRRNEKNDKIKQLRKC